MCGFRVFTQPGPIADNCSCSARPHCLTGSQLVKVGFHANIVDDDTKALAAALAPVFATLGQKLEGEYGGLIEHLWIDLELLEYLAKADGSPRHPFQFQKRVSGRSRFGLPVTPDHFNTGHFSVRPDFALVASLSVERAISHALQRIYQESAVLLGKEKKLGGFDAGIFPERLLIACQHLAHSLPTTSH